LRPEERSSLSGRLVLPSSSRRSSWVDKDDFELPEPETSEEDRRRRARWWPEVSVWDWIILILLYASPFIVRWLAR
jgi:hypothetical protein